MKSTSKRKDFASQVPKIQSDGRSCTRIEKTKKRVGGRHQRTSGLAPSVASLSSHLQFSNKAGSFLEAKNEVPVGSIENEQIHSSKKIKMQLFPIDKNTRAVLEKDGHNPFLELTLSYRKRMSSVTKHLNTKWANSSVSLGELVFFPYDIETQATHRGWSGKDTGVSAGDVYAAIGSPSIFRLRYGWLSNIQSNASQLASDSCHLDESFRSKCVQESSDAVLESSECQIKEPIAATDDVRKPIRSNSAVANENVSSTVPACGESNAVAIGKEPSHPVVQWDEDLTNLSIGDLLSAAPLQGKACDLNSKSETNSSLEPIQSVSDMSIGVLLAEASPPDKINSPNLTLRQTNVDIQPATDTRPIPTNFFWDDSLTAVSVGGLLSEVSLQENSTCDRKSNGSKSLFQLIQPISDSLDAFIAAQVSIPQASKSILHDPVSSILDAEETCHAFPSSKFSLSCKDTSLNGAAVSADCGTSNAFQFSQLSEEHKSNVLPNSRGAHGEENSLGLTGIKWSDSSSPFGLYMTTSQQASGGDVSLSRFVTSHP